LGIEVPSGAISDIGDPLDKPGRFESVGGTLVAGATPTGLSALSN
jgi:hypothetical protein